MSLSGFQTNLNWTNVHAINLTLVNVTSEDNGFTLTCIAENVVGMSNASVALTVHCEWAPCWGVGVVREGGVLCQGAGLSQRGGGAEPERGAGLSQSRGRGRQEGQKHASHQSKAVLLGRL